MRGEVARKAFLRSIGPFFVCVLLSRGVCVLVYCIDIVGKLSVFDVVYPKRDTHTHNLLWLITLNRAPPISLNSPADCHLKMAEREKQRNKWMWTSFKRHKKLSSMLVWREKKSHSKLIAFYDREKKKRLYFFRSFVFICGWKSST